MRRTLRERVSNKCGTVYKRFLSGDRLCKLGKEKEGGGVVGVDGLGTRATQCVKSYVHLRR